MVAKRKSCPLSYIKWNVYNPNILRYHRDHFSDKTDERNISIPEVDQALLSSECIESYHRYGRNDRFLLLGWTNSEPPEPLHIVVEIVRREPFTFVDVCTVYRPDPAIWSADFRKRKVAVKAA